MPDKPHVVHALAWYFPESTGGTEVYVKGLVNGLSASQIKCTLLVPACDASPENHEYRGISVLRYNHPEEPDHLGPESFQARLRSVSPSIYHQHSWTPECGEDHFRLAHSLGIPSVLTAHVPNLHCIRGTMMRDGVEVCDGEVRVDRCAACLLQHRGLPRWMTRPVSSVLPMKARIRNWLPSKVNTLFSIKQEVRERQNLLKALSERAESVVAVCEWLKQALIANGLTEPQLLLSRQGVDPGQWHEQDISPRQQSAFVFGFLGRAHPTKGISIILSAFMQVSETLAESVELHVYAVSVSQEDQRYLSQLKKRFAGTNKIFWKDSVPHDQVGKVLKQFDVLLVPSQWLETGPLVVYEALDAEIPVIGSDIGGIAELGATYANVTLVNAQSEAQWCAAMHQAATSEEPLDWSNQAVRSMNDATEDMMAMYAGIQARRVTS